MNNICRTENGSAATVIVTVILLTIVVAMAFNGILGFSAQSYKSDVKSDLKVASMTLEDSLFTIGAYPNTVPTIDLHPGVVMVRGDVEATQSTITNTYCIEAYHTSSPEEVFSIDTRIGSGINDGACA